MVPHVGWGSSELANVTMSTSHRPSGFHLCKCLLRGSHTFGFPPLPFFRGVHTSRQLLAHPRNSLRALSIECDPYFNLGSFSHNTGAHMASLPAKWLSCFPNLERLVCDYLRVEDARFFFFASRGAGFFIFVFALHAGRPHPQHPQHHRPRSE